MIFKLHCILLFSLGYLACLGTLLAYENLDFPIVSRLVAHRGANNEAPENTLIHYPENTLLALREAYARGAIYVECDVHLTLDGKIIVLHDTTLRRTARYNPDITSKLSLEQFETLQDQEVSRLSYKEQISQVDVGCYAEYLDPAICRGAQVPLLEEFLEELQGHPDRKLLVEIKAGSGIEIVDRLKEMFEGYSKNDQIAAQQLLIISFDLNIMQRVKMVMPDYKAIFLVVTQFETEEVAPRPENFADDYVGLYHRLQDREDLSRIIRLARQAQVDGIGIEYQKHLIDTNFIQQLKTHGLLSYIWTYPKDDNITMVLEMLDSGADLIATNQPQKIFQQLSISRK